MRSRGTLATILISTGSGFVLAAVISACASGAGYHAGLWHFSTGFTILRWSVYAAALGGVVALFGIMVSRRLTRVTAAGAVAAIMAGALIFHSWQLQQDAGTVPRIHDITTDTDNPPQFVALLAVRQRTSNGPEYGGAKIAREQKDAYPDIQPVLLPEPPARAFDRALAAARAMGWEIVAAERSQGQIEATATTRWFRFKDDVIVRIQPSANGSRLDIRSKSRLGRSDLGANATRIRAYVQKLKGV